MKLSQGAFLPFDVLCRDEKTEVRTGLSPWPMTKGEKRDDRPRFFHFEYSYQMLIVFKLLSLLPTSPPPPFFFTSSVDKGFQGSSGFPHL